MLSIEHSVLVVIDVQGNLAQLMYEKETLFENLHKIIKGAQILGLPILWTEQLPDKLGPTIPVIRELLVMGGLQPISKYHFSCCGNEHFMHAFHDLKREQVLLTGIEAHICVYQTAFDLLNIGYDVYIVADAVSSRVAENRQIALWRFRDMGAKLTTTEMALFEFLKAAEGAEFKEIIRLLK